MTTTSHGNQEDGIAGRWRQLRQRLSEKRFIGRLLRDPCAGDATEGPGVLMIKIDGLSYRQLQKALNGNRLPYLRHLIEAGAHELRRFYSGVPSATPAVQGELFFGVKSSVPSIAFMDRKQRKKLVMLFPGSVEEVAEKLADQGTPLLQGGTSYSNIYTGGAAEARYCIQTMRLRSIGHLVSSVHLVIHFLVRPIKFFQMLGYGLIEAGIACFDFIRGATRGKNIFKEIKFIPTRVLVCILLRELVRTRVKMDLGRGMRIVHASLLGYDEQSHRRGPDSAFAHWTLKGIDAAIADMHRTAQGSQCRSYRLIVYSDHGQEDVVSYSKRYGKTAEEAVEELVSAVGSGTGRKDRRCDSIRRSRGFLRQADGGKRKSVPAACFQQEIQVTTMGPLGHVYLQRSISPDRKAQLADKLVHEARIPLVLYTNGDKTTAVNRRGRFDLWENRRQVLGGDHPYLDQTAADLERVCHHSNAGDWIISGWSPNAQALTFAVENGAHGGPGRRETEAFILLPQSNGSNTAVLRPLDLRRYVFELLAVEPNRNPDRSQAPAKRFPG